MSLKIKKVTSGCVMGGVLLSIAQCHYCAALNFNPARVQEILKKQSKENELESFVKKIIHGLLRAIFDFVQTICSLCPDYSLYLDLGVWDEAVDGEMLPEGLEITENRIRKILETVTEKSTQKKIDNILNRIEVVGDRLARGSKNDRRVLLENVYDFRRELEKNLSRKVERIKREREIAVRALARNILCGIIGPKRAESMDGDIRKKVRLARQDTVAELTKLFIDGNVSKEATANNIYEIVLRLSNELDDSNVKDSEKRFKGIIEGLLNKEQRENERKADKEISRMCNYVAGSLDKNLALTQIDELAEDEDEDEDERVQKIGEASTLFEATNNTYDSL